MNKRIDFTKLGGQHTYLDTWEFVQDSYHDALNNLGKFVGEKYVVSGCVEAGGNVSDGEIVVDGERMKFIGGAIAAQIVVETITAQEGFADGTLKTVYYTKQAKFGVVGGFPYAQLKRLPFDSQSIGDCITRLSDIVKNIIHFEPQVILAGCDVSNVAGGNCDISAGLVLFNGKTLQSAAYSGAYPAYLKEDGGWVNAVPGSGLYITFDPHTSQRYKNVLDRAVTPAGKINMYETLTDRFTAGVGRWEMKGYSLVAALQNRVPVGLWFDGIPVDNVSEILHQNAGYQAGEKGHALTAGENGPHTHSMPLGNSFTGNPGPGDNLRAGRGDVNPNDAPTGSSGTGARHNNMQPYTVVVYAKRTA